MDMLSSAPISDDDVRAAYERLTAMQELVSAVLADFVHRPLDEVPAAVDEALARIGDFCGVDRSYVFEFRPGNLMSNTHEWCAPGITPEIDTLQDLPCDMIHFWSAPLAAGQPVEVPHVRALPDSRAEERELLDRQSIQSLLVVPMLNAGQLFGFVGFDSVRSRRIFLGGELSLLSSVANIICAALVRREAAEQLAAQERLKENARRLSDIIYGTNAGTWEWQIPTGEIIGNARYFELIGYDPGDFTPDFASWKRLCHPDDAVIAMARTEAHFRGESDFVSMELRLRHRDGHWVWVLTQGRVVSWTPKGQPAVMSGTNTDISERKAQELALKEARAAAEAANEAKSRFLATMSHEIRTPLNGVLGMAEVLDHNLSDERLSGMLGIIRESGSTLLHLLNDILDYSKIEARALEVEIAPFRVAEVFERVGATFRPLADKKGLNLLISVDDRGATLLGDTYRLGQIANNAVSNAIKFTDHGDVVVKAAVAETGHLSITVRDDGIGMSRSQIDRVFDEFVQADGSTTRRFGGTGLGMAITRRLVKMFDGDIAIESTPGEGTTVRVSIPFELAEPLSKGAAEATGAAEVGSLTGLRILAVDDNGVNRDVLAAMLSQCGADATVVESGVRFLAMLEANRFDALLIDISMPDMDGIRVIETVRLNESQSGSHRTPALACTASVMRDEVRLYHAAGFDGIIAKPIFPQNLVTEIRGVMQEGSGTATQSANREF